MAKLTEEKAREAFAPHLQPGETLTHVAIGVKQPNILLIIVLIALAILPGIIAVAILTKNYCIGLTDRRLIILQTPSLTNLTAKGVIEYSLDELKGMNITTSTGGLFTHIKVANQAKPFQAKFHRALSAFNRPNAMAIGETIASKSA